MRELCSEPSAAPRVILHADMDAFYASVEQRDRPELRGKPVIVGGRPPRGVVSAASYEARRFGVHSAMPSIEAVRRCPQAVFLPGDMPRYGRESRLLRAIFESFSPDVEPLSLDEAFIDVTHSQRALRATPLEIGRRLKDKVRSERSLVVSVGIGPTKMVAKIASDLSKPDGLLEVAPEQVASFLGPLPIGRLPGVGPVTRQSLESVGLRTIGSVAELDDPHLRSAGARMPGGASAGARLLAHLRDLARGRDARAVEVDRDARTYGEESTFPGDVRDMRVLRDAIVHHAEAVARRLRRDGVRGVVVRLKVKSTERLDRPGQYRQYSRQMTLAAATDDGMEIARAATTLLEESRLPMPVRLLGVTVGGIRVGSQGAQLDLFSDPRRGALNRALDQIVERFGDQAIQRGKGGFAKAAPSLGLKRGEAPEAGGRREPGPEGSKSE